MGVISMNQNRYILYARKSTDVEDKQVLSIEAQLAELRNYARDNGLVVVDTIIEKKSAKIPGRPKFGDILERIQNGEADSILAWHPDRLTRNSIDGGQIIYLLDQRKLADLKFQTFWFENTSQGKFMLNIAFGQSKYYVDNLSENTKRGLRQKIRRGEFPGIAPLGYYNDTRAKVVKVDKRQAELVKAIFVLYSGGQSRFQDISAYLYENGIKTSGGKPYSKDKVKYILKNPFYYGHFIYGGEVHEGKHEPIISKKLWDEVQAVIERRSRPTKGLIEPMPYCGLLRCSCGMMITAENKTKRQKNGNIHHYVYYRCTRKNKSVKCIEPAVRSELLDRQLSDLLVGYALPSEYADKMRKLANSCELSEKAKLDGKTDTLRGEITHLSEKLQKLLDGFLDGVLEREIYTQKKAEIMSHKKTIEEQISDFTLGQVEWVEPLKNWLEKAVSICKIVNSTDQNAKKSLLLEIFGLNLFLENKKVVAFSDSKNNSPLKNPWSVLRTANQKIRQNGGNPEIDSELEPPSRLELETPSLPWKCSTTELRRPIFAIYDELPRQF